MKLPWARWLEHIREVGIFLKWVLYACGIGLLVGGVAVAFHLGIDWGTHLRSEFPWVVFFLPLGGPAIVLIYRVCGMEKDRGTNLVLTAVREAEPMKLRTAPLIFLSTVLTHLVGGSAGREGAALQLGGSLAAWVGRNIRLDEKDRRVMVMCGMSAAFSALFGTPLTAAIFSMEVVSVGVMYYAALVPCATAAITAFMLAQFCGLHANPGYEIGAVTLPLEVVEQHDGPVIGAAAGEASGEAAAEAAGSLAGQTILVAEDNELNMEIVTELLTMSGAQVIGASNGAEAVEKFQRAAPYSVDAILMDMQMPVLDGCGAARAIRRLDRPDAAVVPIVAVTANAFAEDVDRTTAAGMNAHVSKPIDMDRLLEALALCWAGKTPPAPAPGE